MKTACTVQCPQCPFRPTSLPGYLGDYTPASIFESLWRGIPFFCHVKVRYEDPKWLEKAQENGKVCLGSLAFSDQMCAPTRPDAYPTTDPIVLKLREENRGRTDIALLGTKQFMDWHGEDHRGANIKKFKTLKSTSTTTIP